MKYDSHFMIHDSCSTTYNLRDLHSSGFFPLACLHELINQCVNFSLSQTNHWTSFDADPVGVTFKQGVVKTEEKLADCYHDNRCYHLTFNAKHWLVVIVGCLLNFFAFSHLTCSRVKETIFIQKQEQPALKLVHYF
ncbi:hypothetical protein T4D_9945 [Trichinella pseudospiralis]|uniref:Uncharacterized protein n=1 Tax=Trichinella pseudospiralis TaxID=6337 RepID=A0A0V1FHK5_TRIPS|nr:hypothetical protein T4D_9945 [Trichinella pseudospiralis]